MNFYKRYVGDIQRDTGHLSLAEFGAYDRLLDHYYATESALPTDIDACCRIARAMSKDERKAVISILNQYFEITDRGYEQKRAEKEIAEAKPAMVAARLNGSKGGRPKKQENKTQEKPSGFSENNQDETQHESSPEPEPYYELSNVSENCNLVAETEKTHTQIQVGLISKSLQAIGLMPFNPSLPDFIAVIESGATPDEFANTALEFKGNESKFNFKYILSVIVKRRQDVAQGLHQGALPAKTDREQGRYVAGLSIFTPENTKHLQGVQLKTINEVHHDKPAIAA
jgi:uncharacterized protein YdaU (DUF1376 family)